MISFKMFALVYFVEYDHIPALIFINYKVDLGYDMKIRTFVLAK